MFKKIQFEDMVVFHIECSLYKMLENYNLLEMLKIYYIKWLLNLPEIAVWSSQITSKCWEKLGLIGLIVFNTKRQRE